jgi:hypothetical protein
MTKLGKVEYIELRDLWPDEARNFTPWLAAEEGLELLGEAINAELELVEREAKVGPFNADILCRLWCINQETGVLRPWGLKV